VLFDLPLAINACCRLCSLSCGVRQRVTPQGCAVAPSVQTRTLNLVCQHHVELMTMRCAHPLCLPVQSRLGSTHEVVQISQQQMDALCGNALELLDGRGLPILAMSTQAYNAFTEDQRRIMRQHVADLVHAPIDTLENVGGGGVRCCIAELF